MKIVKFMQSNCAPCKMLDNYLTHEVGVEVDQVVNLSEGKDENLELAGRYGIMKTPTLVLVDEDGNEIDKFSGVGQTGVQSILAKRGLI